MGEAAGDVFIHIRHLTGSAFYDSLEGDGQANWLQGLAGDDSLRGGAGADTLDGGAGNNTASYAGSAFAVTVNLALQTALGATQSGGDADGDVLRNIQNLLGSQHGDLLAGDAQDNRIEGGGGDDQIRGGEGKDRRTCISATRTHNNNGWRLFNRPNSNCKQTASKDWLWQSTAAKF